MTSIPLSQILCTLPQIQRYFPCPLLPSNVPIFVVIFEAKLSAVKLQNITKTIFCFNPNKKGETKASVKLQKNQQAKKTSTFVLLRFLCTVTNQKKNHSPNNPDELQCFALRQCTLWSRTPLPNRTHTFFSPSSPLSGKHLEQEGWEETQSD